MLSPQNRERIEEKMHNPLFWTPFATVLVCVRVFFFLLLLLTSSSHLGFIFIFKSVLVFFLNPFFLVCFGFYFLFILIMQCQCIHNFLTKKIVFFLFNRGMRVNLYNLPFLNFFSSLHFSTSNQTLWEKTKIFCPPTFSFSPLFLSFHFFIPLTKRTLRYYCDPKVCNLIMPHLRGLFGECPS